MSPEQLMGKSSIASDVYSMGAMLYEMLQGEPPFRSGFLPDQIRSIVPDPPEGVSPAMRAIVMKCLEKKPENRYATAGSLRADLEAARRLAAEEEQRRVAGGRDRPELRATLCGGVDADKAPPGALWDLTIADLKDSQWLVGEYDGSRWYSNGVIALRGDPPFPAQKTRQVPMQAGLPVNSTEVTLRSVYANQSGQEYVVLYNPPAICYAVAERRFFDYINRRFPGCRWWYDAKKGILGQGGAGRNLNAAVTGMRLNHDDIPGKIRQEIDVLRAGVQPRANSEPKRYHVDAHSISTDAEGK